MKVNKKLKNLLNSVANGSKLEGALNKIHEEFLKDITEKVESLKSQKDELEDAVKQCLKENEEILSEREERVRKIRIFLRDVDLGQLEKIRENLIKTLEEIKGINTQYLSDQAKRLIDEGLIKITDAFDQQFDHIRQWNSSERKESNESKKAFLDRIEGDKKNFKEQVEIWRASIIAEHDVLSKKNALFITNAVPNLVTEYIQNNTFKILWDLICGLFRFGKSKKDKK